jgi:hypothetical protein
MDMASLLEQYGNSLPGNLNDYIPEDKVKEEENDGGALLKKSNELKGAADVFISDLFEKIDEDTFVESIFHDLIENILDEDFDNKIMAILEKKLKEQMKTTVKSFELLDKNIEIWNNRAWFSSSSNWKTKSLNKRQQYIRILLKSIFENKSFIDKFKAGFIKHAIIIDENNIEKISTPFQLIENIRRDFLPVEDSVESNQTDSIGQKGGRYTKKKIYNNGEIV